MFILSWVVSSLELFLNSEVIVSFSVFFFQMKYENKRIVKTRM